MIPAAQSSNNVPNLIFYALLAVWFVVGAFYIRYRRIHRKTDTTGTSVLLDYYTDGVNLTPLKTGLIGDLHYNAIAAMPQLRNDGEAALIYQVELPFKTTTHLVGIPKKTGATQLNPAGDKSLMERVELEGDYNDYFSLYTEKGMQQDSRYVLDPKAMVFTIDFCQSNNWEIVDNQLYFVRAKSNTKHDSASISDNILQFVKEIQPAIAVPLSDKEIEARAPYNQEYRNDLKCPVCQAKLDNKGDYLICPNNHGTLLKGSVLAKLNEGELTLNEAPIPTQPNMHGTLTCPSCGNTMEQTNYNGSSIIIDTCSHCPYRWLDSGESIKTKEQ